MQRIICALVVWVALAAPLACSAAASGHVVLLQVNGVIGPATSDYVTRNLHKAKARGAALVIMQLDTPGGLDTAMRAIIQEMLASPVPVVVYVAPAGARAASAGTYLIYASHVAAMAPGTNLGAATPVQIGSPLDGDDEKKAGASHDDPLSRKMVNDAGAYIHALARLRGRNAEWSETAVRGAASVAAEEALRLGVVELIARDVPALLAEIDGRRVTTVEGERVLATRNLVIDEVAPDWRARLLALITDPNVAYVLILVGIYGLIYELASPGMVLPGVVGAICLLLALFAFHVWPIIYAGLGRIIVCVAFMVGEEMLTSFGALGIGGVLAFIIGSVM